MNHAEIANRFVHVCRSPSDINEHCLDLFQLASHVRHVTEFGTRAGVSTTAFLAARPQHLICYDLVVSDEARRIADLSAGVMQIHQGNTLELEIAETDLLFIDTFHTYRQLREELQRHAGKVRRWIVLHDTTTFGERGENGGPGLWPAVEEFLAAHPEWIIQSRVHHCNGLTVLVRQS